MAIPFTKFTTRKWAVLTSKIDKLFIVIGINRHQQLNISEITTAITIMLANGNRPFEQREIIISRHLC